MENIIKFYCDKGFAIFPCRNKKPLTPNGYKDATKDYDKAIELFKPHYPCDVGIATGDVSGIYVLDIDEKNDAGGGESLNQLELAHSKLPGTVEVLTRNGGRHLYFKYVEGIGCKARFRKGLDVRGDGGYVIAPPSEGYEWEINHHIEDAEILDSPEWLIDIIKSKKLQEIPSDTIIPEGKRNDELTRLAGRFRVTGLNEKELTSLLIDMNKSRCNPPLPIDEVVGIAKSIASYPIDFIKSPFTDMWNANLLIENHGNEIRYCPQLGGWMIWDSTKWIQDKTARISSFVEETIRKIHAMAKAENDPKMSAHAIRSENSARIDAFVKIAKGKVQLEAKHFDNDQYLLNLLNGTYNLETGLMQSHNRLDYITRQINISLDPEAKCPTWERFMSSIFSNNADIIRFMQKAVGYSLTGNTSEQCIFILYGVGMNGKSTFLKHIYALMGDYSMNTPSETLTERSVAGIPNDIARLKGTRFVTAFETNANTSLAEAKIKQFTGDDPVSARYLHQEYFDFIPTFKIFMATNHKPRIKGTDHGIWRRIRAIPFNRVISEAEKDRNLDKKLRYEYQGILNWAIEGYHLWKEEGLGKVKEIEDHTDEYRKNNDIIGNFFSECCTRSPEYRINVSDLFKHLQIWLKENGYRTMRRNDFQDYMHKAGYVKERKTSRGEDFGKYFYLGIKMMGIEDELSEYRELAEVVSPPF